MTYDLGETVYQKLAGVVTITSLIGTRIYPIKMPDNVVYPAISFQFISGMPRVHTMSNDTGNPYGVRLQISCWAETITEARDLQELVRAEFQDYTGTFIGGLTFQRIFTESEALEIYSESAEVYQVTRDYLLWV